MEFVYIYTHHTQPHQLACLPLICTGWLYDPPLLHGLTPKCKLYGPVAAVCKSPYTLTASNRNMKKDPK